MLFSWLCNNHHNEHLAGRQDFQWESEAVDHVTTMLEKTSSYPVAQSAKDNIAHMETVHGRLECQSQSITLQRVSF